MMTVGYVLFLSGILIMFFWGIGNGLGVFALAYLLYVVGRSIYATARDMGTPILTNEPQQRISYGRYSTIYTSVFSVAMSSYLSMVLAPKYGGLTVEAFQELCLICVIGGTILTIASMFAIAPMIKQKALPAAGQSAITTLVFGVIIGNYTFNGPLRMITLVPTILMVFFATKLRGKGNTKTQLIKWTWVAIRMAVAIVALCIAAVGYTTTMPQPGDPATTPVFWMTMFLWMGLPILGWLSTQILMPFYPLNRDKMEEIQCANKELREKTAMSH